MIYSSFDLRRNHILKHPQVRVVLHKNNKKLNFNIRKDFFAQENIDLNQYSKIFTDEYPTPEVYTAYVKNILVSPKSVGLPRYWAMFFDNHYIYNFINEHAKNSFEARNIFKRLPEDKIDFNSEQIKPIYIPGKSIWLYTFKNMDHLVRECLPALLTLKEINEDYKNINFIIPTTNQDILEILYALDIPNDNIIQIDSKWIKFEELILPCFSSFGHLHTPTDYYLNTSKLLKNEVSKMNIETIQPKRLYVSRRNAKMRRLLNEDVLHDGLKSRGFTIIEPGDFSKIEQINLFSNAEIIVGQHGMGIANAAFSGELKLLIEIMSTTYNRVSYFRTAQLLSCNYSAYYVEPQNKKYAFPNDPSGDILLDPNLFFKYLDDQLNKI